MIRAGVIDRMATRKARTCGSRDKQRQECTERRWDTDAWHVRFLWHQLE